MRSFLCFLCLIHTALWADLSHAHVGAYAVDHTTGEVLLDTQSDKLFIPASVTKLFTSVAALELLGEEYRFSTDVCSDKELTADGVIDGNLYLVGGCDPDLKAADIRELARRVYACGVRTILGQVITDESRYGGRKLPTHAEHDDLFYPYATEITPLSVDDNCVTIRINNNELIIDQEVDYCQILPAAYSSDTPVMREPMSNTFRLAGDVQEPWQMKAALFHPGQYAGRIFVDELHKLGVVMRGEAILDEEKRYTIASHTSAPLGELLKKMNKMSHNLTGELLLRVLPEDATKRYEIDPNSCRLFDGAGLSRHNLVSPKAVVALLQHAVHASYAALLIDSLPIGGVDGTLASRLKDLPEGTFVKAKTGTLSGVSALAGILRTKDERDVLFSIFINNTILSTIEVKQAVDALVLQILLSGK